MSGLILLDKSTGMTSFAACAAIRRITGEKKVGHTGTLDPMATGVLPVLVGRATALARYMTDSDKAYSATVRLGVTTDTMDMTGDVVKTSAVNTDMKTVEETVASMAGDRLQTPPMYSAVKRGGVRLYQLARQGKSVEVEPRHIKILSIKITRWVSETEFEMDVVCSKGTYIRVLANDIGDLLGCGAVLSALRRNCAAGFDISRTVTLKTLEEKGASAYMIAPADILPDMRSVTVTAKQATRFANGGELSLERIDASDVAVGDLFRVVYAGDLIGVGRIDTEHGVLAPETVIASPENLTERKRRQDE